MQYLGIPVQYILYYNFILFINNTVFLHQSYTPADSRGGGGGGGASIAFGDLKLLQRYSGYNNSHNAVSLN